MAAASPIGQTSVGVPDWELGGVAIEALVVQALLVVTVILAVTGTYAILLRFLIDHTESKHRKHDARNLLRFVFIIFAIVGFAVTFALQQPLFSLIGWMKIMIKKPYSVGDRVAIEGSTGDVVEVDFLVTTLWEINGELVSSNQPSGRVITLPNSVVLSSHVYNYSYQDFPYVWNELSIQLAYETDLELARELMVEVADNYLGDEMETAIERYRKRLDETPVELEVGERPSVNVHQVQSWVELRLRYLVHPRRGTRGRNVLYERILDRMSEHPDRVAFPVSRSR